ncbi:hypothetical protein JX265_008620 [Neoarthrinium moseri]|uniref:Uncharacterized protein n=1 Tax=Neoarthrinium moseri TaxID=1658444 RepID=A0A9P9WHY0_9PEZI|nr:uncharacterized protein JN550_012997 [Neoarthrinium moseri]KAI1849210.1 hypothetical protein JX266_005171 [Neoarthrinium moseri]KAI1857857.1 hypothetical protein JN550_012997 [Neoarthrinium moseri]KAI1864249.1 hypothetical protein JX265_008620 [Neoarthrinium moseri]
MGVLRKLWIALAVTSVILSTVLAEFPTTSDAKCNCYLTNTTTKNWFSRHKFFDFRNMSQYVNVPGPAQNPSAASDAGVASSYFESADWTNFWSLQRWNNSLMMRGNSDVTGSDATVLMVNSPSNVYFENNKDTKAASKTYMTMRTVRHQDFQSAAEFESGSGNYHYLSIRMLARTRGASGAITAMFTYRGAQSLQSVQEADLEVRTRDPSSSIQYTNQPSWNANGDIAGATKNITQPGKVNWNDWQYHRMDWTPGSTNWFVNGQLVSTISFQAPRDPSQIIFNAWSDGGSWSGNMSVGSEAYLQIQWIDVVYNNTDPAIGFKPTATNGKCGSICSIDETKTVGTPVLITTTPQNPSGGQSGSNPGSPGSPSGGQACFAAKYGQCAGKNWNGCTGCAAGTTCRFQNDYYSQCL